MSKIKILNNALTEQGIINDVLSSSITEMINSDKTLDFSVWLTSTMNDLIQGDNVIEVNDDYYDIAEYKKGQSNNGKLTADVSCEHISYRLNDPEYDLEYFTHIGTPEYILGKILYGTDFTVGTIEFTASITYSLQEAKSRRQILMEFVELLGGEVNFNKFEISIMVQRGSVVAKNLLVDRNIEVLSKTYNKRETDDDGNPLVSYECTLIRPLDIALGDVVTIDYASLDIDVQLRIVSLTTNPYNKYEEIFVIGNFNPGLADDAYRIETSTLTKGKSYYGARISPENGFESIRNDKMARSVFNADTFAMQSGDGSGSNWANKLYFDPALGKYVFDGDLSATTIEALQSVITPNLYAGKATIAELTVDQLDTGTKVQKYLSGSKTDVNYIKIHEQYIQFITASTDGTTVEQATNRDGALLYWDDDTKAAASTTETDYPVMMYAYTELVKAEFAFEFDGSNYVPKITLGTGDGVTGNSAKAEIYKASTGLEINYYKSNTGELRQIKLADTGITINGLAYELTALNIASDSFQASYGDVVQNAYLTKNDEGYITTITTSDATIPITYNEVV
jgi:hypothetical protein